MRVITLGLLALCLVSCASAKFGKKFTAQQVASIRKCAHTRAQLEAYFGPPMQEGVQDGYVSVMWQYADMELSAFDSTDESVRKQRQGQGTLIVFFNQHNVVVDYAYNPVSLPHPIDRCR